MKKPPAPTPEPPAEPRPPWKRRLYIIIFESNTVAGKAFDLVLLVVIGLSVAVVMLESVASVRARYEPLLLRLEWLFTGLFTVEYVARLACARRPAQYARSFFGIIDLLAILPTYLSLFLAGAHYMMVIRVLRLLRIFRILKLAHFLEESRVLVAAMRASRRKVTVFLFGVLTTVTIMGALMYVVEGGQNGFTSIPRSVYWAVVTLTTVGYGDIAPVTILGQFVASLIMIMGYGIIAVPTGIFSLELREAAQSSPVARTCPACKAPETDPDARYCRRCGGQLA